MLTTPQDHRIKWGRHMMGEHKYFPHLRQVAEGCERWGDLGGSITVTHRLGAGHRYEFSRMIPADCGTLADLSASLGILWCRKCGKYLCSPIMRRPHFIWQSCGITSMGNIDSLSHGTLGHQIPPGGCSPMGIPRGWVNEMNVQ